MKEYCLALDLKNDSALIKTYEAYHQNVWPEIIEAIKDSGILDMRIYRIENRLIMILVTTDEFSFEKKAALDLSNHHVQEWEKLMSKYQQSLPGSKSGKKWVVMDKIFDLNQDA